MNAIVDPMPPGDGIEAAAVLELPLDRGNDAPELQHDKSTLETKI